MADEGKGNDQEYHLDATRLAVFKEMLVNGFHIEKFSGRRSARVILQLETKSYRFLEWGSIGARFDIDSLTKVKKGPGFDFQKGINPDCCLRINNSRDCLTLMASSMAEREILFEGFYLLKLEQDHADSMMFYDSDGVLRRKVSGRFGR